jgi:kynurenine formamidase
VRRVIDVTQAIDITPPLAEHLPPDVRPPHKESLGDGRRREDLLFYLDIQDAHLGEKAYDRLQYLSMTADPAGTHVETYYPKKWFYEGDGQYLARDVANIPTQTLVNEAIVFDVPDLDHPVTAADLDHGAKHLRPGDGILIRSGVNSAWADSGLNPSAALGAAYDLQRTGVTLGAAKWLTERGVRLVAIDFRNPEDPNDLWELPSHRELHTNDVLIVEDAAHLDRLTDDRVLLLAGSPLKGRNLTGGAARLVAIEGYGTNGVKAIDLTHVLGPYGSEGYAGSRQELEADETNVLARAEAMFFDISQTGLVDMAGPQYMRFSTRAGTHLINPLRFETPDDRTLLYGDVTEIPLSDLVRPGVLFNLAHIGPRTPITVRDIEPYLGEVEAGDWVFMRTDNVDWYRTRPDRREYSPYLTIPVLERLASLGIKGIVTDIESFAPPSARADFHAALHRLGILYVGGAWRLRLIRKRRFLAAILPLLVRGLTSSSAHVFVIEDW